MGESLFSPSWYRVAQLKPRLRGHANVHRHEYRGELWYVLQDQAKGRYYRFNPTTFELIGRMNGRWTVQELWEATAERLGDDAPTQNEVVQLMGQRDCRLAGRAGDHKRLRSEEVAVGDQVVDQERGHKEAPEQQVLVLVPPFVLRVLGRSGVLAIHRRRIAETSQKTRGS